ncbi:MAG: PDGLE domain-containing protein [Candidatus Hydrogenedentes bacterium]|nr:PDGLE domain-containing protein [Candidatus Hydrogenedentota bacterium]
MTRASKFFVIAGMAIAVLALLAPFASKTPDGLEKVAQDAGFAERGEAGPAGRFTLLRDYAIPGVHNKFASTALAGLIGAALVFGVTFGVGRMLARRPSPQNGKKP